MAPLSLRQRFDALTHTPRRLERLIARGEQALAKRDWSLASAVFAKAHRVLGPRTPQDPTETELLRGRLAVAWLTLQAHLGALAELEVACRTLSVLPGSARPPELSLDGMRALGATLIAEGHTASAALLAGFLITLLGESATTCYLSARLLGAHARALHARRQPVRRVTEDAALAFTRAAALSEDPLRAQRARLRHAALHLDVATDSAAARRALDGVATTTLDPEGLLIYAHAHLDAPRALRRVRALDALDALVDTTHASHARALLLHRLSRIDVEQVTALERDRLIHTIPRLLPEAVGARALQVLTGAPSAGSASDETLLDTWSGLLDALDPHARALAERYHACLEQLRRGGLDAVAPLLEDTLPPPPEQAPPFAMGLRLLQHALDVTHAPADVEVLLRLLLDETRTPASALRPVAALIPALLDAWTTLSDAQRDLSRDVIRRYLKGGHHPGYGLGALAEALLAADEIALAADVLLAIDLDDDTLNVSHAIAAFLLATRQAVDDDDASRARALLSHAQRLASAPPKNVPSD